MSDTPDDPLLAEIIAKQRESTTRSLAAREVQASQGEEFRATFSAFCKSQVLPLFQVFANQLERAGYSIEVGDDLSSRPPKVTFAFRFRGGHRASMVVMGDEHVGKMHIDADNVPDGRKTVSVPPLAQPDWVGDLLREFVTISIARA